MLNPQGPIRGLWEAGLDWAWEQCPNVARSGQWKEHFVRKQWGLQPSNPPAPATFHHGRKLGGSCPCDSRKGGRKPGPPPGLGRGAIDVAQAFHAQMGN